MHPPEFRRISESDRSIDRDRIDAGKDDAEREVTGKDDARDAWGRGMTTTSETRGVDGDGVEDAVSMNDANGNGGAQNSEASPFARAPVSRTTTMESADEENVTLAVDVHFLRRCFERIDREKRGEVTLGAFLEAWQTDERVGSLLERGSRIAGERDRVPPEEMARRAREVFDKMDADDSATVTFEEFARYFDVKKARQPPLGAPPGVPATAVRRTVVSAIDPYGRPVAPIQQQISRSGSMMDHHVEVAPAPGYIRAQAAYPPSNDAMRPLLCFAMCIDAEAAERIINHARAMNVPHPKCCFFCWVM